MHKTKMPDKLLKKPKNKISKKLASNYTIMKKIFLLSSVFFPVFTITATAQTISDTLALAINEHNTISVKTVFNETDTLTLNFDTGTTELVLTNNTIKSKLKSAINLYNTDYPLQIGNTTYQTKVYDAQLTGHGTDGRFGWDFFKGKVVELNYDKDIMVIHHQLPAHVMADNTYARHNMVFYKDLFFIELGIKQSGVTVTDNFLFDTGYERTLMLNRDLLTTQKFPYKKMKEIKRVLMKEAQGNNIPVVTSSLQKLTIGKHQ